MKHNAENNASRFAANAGSIFTPLHRVVSARAWHTWVKVPTGPLGRLVTSSAGLTAFISVKSKESDAPDSNQPASWRASGLLNIPLSAAEVTDRLGSAIAVTHRDPPVIDDVIWQRLQRLENESPGFMATLIDLFLRDAEMRLHTLKEVMARRQIEVFARETRALKAGCLQIGALGMVELCEALLNATATPTLAWADIIYGYLSEEYQRVRDCLARLRLRP